MWGAVQASPKGPIVITFKDRLAQGLAIGDEPVPLAQNGARRLFQANKMRRRRPGAATLRLVRKVSVG